MITKDNFQKLLLNLGFIKESIGDFYTRSYDSCSISVDFDNERLLYPTNKGLKVNDKTTSNFSHNENFVVFECVCRLLEKGYRPEHIELEPKWQLGHDSKAGKADIVVKDENGDVFLIIECKTYGPEYNKAIKNTEEDGGQLFSYWQQENSTRWLALYASDWKDDDIILKSQIINCSDDANILKMSERDKDVLVFKNAHNEKERFQVWEETYNKSWLDNLIFDNDSQAYRIGIPPLRKCKLRDFTPDDKIVNRFEEILRHNNVSDKENAFNRLVALFICKLVDEIKKQDFEEVEFQYKQGVDTYESLQDRLQRLHTQGMEQFMKEKIFYVAADYAERLFQQYTGSQRKKAIEDLNNTIRILKFYSNNDFAFKDVHNEELFYQNGKILVEVVQLFQPYRIVYPSKHQFLGDLFEQLLNKGFKQNEGQFFTPTPITRFIWDSLPLQSYISDHGLPNVIDYACGAGHFLTEGIEAINSVRQEEDNSWVEKHIYGVEKDYRLARVSKISLFMNGAGGANIIFGDGLENYQEKNIDEGRFDILVANPPYAVNGFKQHLKLRNNSFHLLNTITNDGKEIETLFVERIAQLLRPQGIAAVVLPVSILNNSSSCYTAAREELLKNFYLHAIVSFGSKTFGATGTNTVTLFLERYNEPPKLSELVKDCVEAIITGEDITNFVDKQILMEYLQMQNISEEDYHGFLTRAFAMSEMKQIPYFKTYIDAFSAMPINYPKNSTKEEKELISQDKFYDFANKLEKDKLYYFALIHNQQTLFISAPNDNKEQKEFLGYDWSNRKGNEGIIINTPGGKMYNTEDRFARGTLACAIRNSFINASTLLPENLSKYVKSYPLKDMVDFSLSFFNKTINPNVQIQKTIHSKYPLIKLNDPKLFDLKIGKRVLTSEIIEQGAYPIYSANVREVFGYIDNLLFEDFDKDSILWGIDGDWMVGFIEKGNKFYPTDHCGVLRILDKNIEPYYVALVLDLVGFHYDFSRSNRASIERVSSVQIPLPPLSVQKKIVVACKAIDKEYNTSRMTIDAYRQKIAQIFDSLSIVKNVKTGGGKTY